MSIGEELDIINRFKGSLNFKMGSNFFNRDDPFLIQFAVLSLVGFWHVDSDKKWVRVAYAVYRFLSVFSVTSLIFIEIIDIINLKEDSTKTPDRVCAAMITCIVTTKTHIMLRWTNAFYKLQEKLQKFREMRSKYPDDIRLLQKTFDEIVLVTKFFYTAAVVAVLFWTLHPMLQEDNRQLPFPIRLPIDMEKSPFYEILYAYLTAILIMFTGSVVATVVGYGSYLTIINTHFEVVKKSIENISSEREEVVRRKRFWEEFNVGKYIPEKTPEEREAEENQMKDARTMEILKEAIESQNFIYDEVESFKLLQKEYLLVHILAVVFGLSVVETTGLSDDFTIHLAKRLLILSLGIVDIFSICIFGEELQYRSCKMAEALYMTPWDEMDVKIQKVILLMSIRTRRPCLIKAGGTIRINLATYLNVMRIGYNFTLLLRHSASRST